VRIAGVYHLDPRTLAVEHLGWPADTLVEIDLGPAERIRREFSQLTRLSENAVERHTVRGANPGWLPDWVTLRTPVWNTTDYKPLFPAGVLFNVCPACLHEDLNQGGPFIRMGWLCAATTICNEHVLPLRECFDSLDSPFECRHGRSGLRFSYYGHQEGLDAPLYDRQSSKMLAMMGEFERTVRSALTARSHVSGSNFDVCANEEFISVVEDLTWALLQMVGVDGTRMVHYFQTEPFPVPRGWRAPFPVETLSRADIGLRRSVLAVVACLLRPRQFAELSRTSPRLCLPSRYSELLRHLGITRSDWLLSRAHRWPPAFREQMERAA
jgi:hypothetical protein